MAADAGASPSPGSAAGESDLTETRLSSRVAYRGRFLEMRADEVSLPDGQTALREYIVHPGAVIILALFENGDVLMERQFRYPLRRHFYELPAGKMELGEPSLETAKRELQEETGCRAGHWELLTRTHPCIGYSDEIIDLYLARDLQFEARALDQGEFLDVFRLPFDDALGWVREGRISDSKTILGLLWYRQFLSGTAQRT
jgi:ADP-ribose pyrophosphatase